MNEEELRKIWQALDSRISTINDRTKSHTLQIKEQQKEIKDLKAKIKTLEGNWRI